MKTTKKIIFYLFSVTVLCCIVSCSMEEDNIFDKSPDARLQEKLLEHQQALCNAPYGWLVAVGTKDRGSQGGAYRFWMTFKPEGRVVMQGDINDLIALTPQESSYRLKAMQLPTLMFDTYNYLHILADTRPAAEIPTGKPGYGLTSDYDILLMNDIVGDTFNAEGRLQGCPFIFTKATQSDMNAIVTDGMLTEIRRTVIGRLFPISFPAITVDGFTLYMFLGPRLSVFVYKDNRNVVQTILIPSYAEFNGGIRLMWPFEYNNIRFDYIRWDNSQFLIAVNGTDYVVTDAGDISFPLDLGASKAFTSIRVCKDDLNTTDGESLLAPFLTVYDNMYNGGLNSATSPYRIPYYRLSFGYDEQRNERAILSIEFRSTAGTAYNSEGYFKVNRDPDGAIYFTDFSRPETSLGSNMNTIGARIVSYAPTNNLFRYLLYSGTYTLGSSTVQSSGNKFRVRWTTSHTPGVGPLAGLYPVSDPANYMPGTLND